MKDLLFSFVFVFALCMGLTAQDEPTPASLYNDGLTALKAKDYAAAFDNMIAALDKANPDEDSQVIQLANRNGAIAAYYYGSTLSKENETEKAMEIHEKGIQMNPDFYGNYVGMAKIYVDKDDVANAVDSYLEAANKRVKEGKADRAKSYFENADKLIAIAYSKDMVDQTIAACEIAIAKNETAEAHYYKAKALIDSDSADNALTHALKAHELGGDADESKYIFLLAEIHESNGDKTKALDYYKNVGQGKYFEMAQYKINQGQ